MKNIFLIFTFLFLAISCEENMEVSSVNPVNWAKRMANKSTTDSLLTGKTYLSVYSQIHSRTEHITHDLTVTVSMRNVSSKDTIFIEKAEYFNTEGKLIRTYFDKLIFIAPMETVEIVINEDDQDGGTGANFIFDWKIKPNSNTPFFEGIMISTSGTQGLSFTTQGRTIKP
jgi:hypothetical protein